MFRILATALVAILPALPVLAEPVVPDYGDNTGSYPFDGECDDPRFVGIGTSRSVDLEETGHDAADCKLHFELGTVKLWDEAQARAATVCEAIYFGDNSSEWANDGECDDLRFTGEGVDAILLWDDLGRDSKDCRKACEDGTALLRNY